MRMLAVHTMTASGHMPSRQSSIAPEKIVSLRTPPELSVVRTGSTLAGTSIAAAASASAAAVDGPLGARRKFMALPAR